MEAQRERERIYAGNMNFFYDLLSQLNYLIIGIFTV